MNRLQRVRENLRKAYNSGRESVRETRADEVPAGSPSIDDDFVPPAREPELVHGSISSRDDAEVPHSLRIAAAWSWRLIVVGVIGWALLHFVAIVSIVVVPLAIALLLSAILAPAVSWLLKLKVPRSLATFMVLICGIAAVAGTLTLVITQFVDGADELTEKASDGVRQIQDWARNGPLHLSDDQVNRAIEQGQAWVNSHTSQLTSTGIATAATLFEVVTGMLLVLFSTFFFLRDGRKIWRFIVRLFPVNARWSLADAGDASWATLSAYVRATVLVAFIDALGVGIALVVLHIPFPFPLAALVFLGAFIPIVGAGVSGTVAVLVALVDQGWVIALVVLGAVILVQQVEGHVLQPLIMGRAVAIHPLVVIIGIACGATLAGIIGALVAVPLIAVLNTGVRRLARTRPEVPASAVVVGGGTRSGPAPS
ncbi:AI-2E family transporter [Paractinoplanes ferrugineus]|uniref:AI-2E family transporter n=1 Tax=Paractinoplanes ferrugineus TaxID=113564 RepID=A0A919ITR4_9ACTN|nr:AI-2E family transporter [Actinoplanes ferrugineus]GIE08360.1 AI-2E family transporter [Actinoplanes ferrugineus]